MRGQDVGSLYVNVLSMHLCMVTFRLSITQQPFLRKNTVIGYFDRSYMYEGPNCWRRYLVKTIWMTKRFLMQRRIICSELLALHSYSPLFVVSRSYSGLELLKLHEMNIGSNEYPGKSLMT